MMIGPITKGTISDSYVTIVSIISVETFVENNLNGEQNKLNKQEKNKKKVNKLWVNKYFMVRVQEVNS